MKKAGHVRPAFTAGPCCQARRLSAAVTGRIRISLAAWYIGLGHQVGTAAGGRIAVDILGRAAAAGTAAAADRFAIPLARRLAAIGAPVLVARTMSVVPNSG